MEDQEEQEPRFRMLLRPDSSGPGQRQAQHLAIGFLRPLPRETADDDQDQAHASRPEPPRLFTRRVAPIWVHGQNPWAGLDRNGGPPPGETASGDQDQALVIRPEPDTAPHAGQPADTPAAHDPAARSSARSRMSPPITPGSRHSQLNQARHTPRTW
ncbi:hypothetical protein [Amycolatopsis rubida]|uniref:Uncharacterized protein n=1 Tax=Amycolatopsis rubida TaxID=112413 RepID=A0A1I5XE42_9PSEU|nr:hypothetical protein [Amycolatopsis rubida]SFQ29937.1 hypothetical protein SAMN05421854_110166 [Amycolatopsis rubida]